MTNCKKFKSTQIGQAAYHTQPAGGCADCVYFSAKNCGCRGSAATGAMQDSLQFPRFLLY